MKHFINEYEYTTDIISESMAVWWMRYFRNGYITMGIFIFLILSLALFRMQLIYLLLEPLPILIIVLFKVKEKRAVKLEQERMSERTYINFCQCFRGQVSVQVLHGRLYDRIKRKIQ